MSRSKRLIEFLGLKAPKGLKAAIERAAEREFMSASEYIRRAIIDRLRADKVEIRSS